MTTKGLAAFDEETQEAYAAVLKRPFDCFGNPIFCRSCTDRLGRGFTARCPRWGTATEQHCPFRNAMNPALSEAEE